MTEVTPEEIEVNAMRMREHTQSSLIALLSDRAAALANRVNELELLVSQLQSKLRLHQARAMDRDGKVLEL